MDKREKEQINSLVRDPRWQAVEVFVAKFLNQNEEFQVKANDEFNTVYNLGYKEGKKDGVKQLINELEQI
jgi:hypothetical protein